MNPIEVVPVLPNPALPDANWADAFEITTRRHFDTMRALAKATVGSMPSWVKNLLALRNIIVRPFGLKPDGVADAPAEEARVGIFPIIEETDDTITLGLNDRHLDFRIVLERTVGGVYEKSADLIRITTLVKRHNLFGRTYIAVIMPFHKAIAAKSLKQAA